MHGSSSPDGGSSVLDRGDDVVVRSAAAEIAAHPVADFLRRTSVALCNAGDAGHDLSGRAIAALESIALDKSSLQRMEPLALCQALNGRDLAPVHEGSEREARFDPFAVHKDRAGAALAEATAFF